MRLAAVQPRSHSGQDEHRNVDDALVWLRRAADTGAELVVFPEGYPGPTNPANRYDALGPLGTAARDLGLHVLFGRVVDAGDGRHHVALTLLDAAGRELATYLRTTPRGPYIYRDIPAWNFDYQEADAVPAPVPVGRARLGTLVCSEVYVPELSRLLTLRGADVIAYPAGGAINELLPSWRTVVRARAIENLVYTVVVQNLYEADEEGVAVIASPEGDLASATGEDLLVADLDLERLRYLRDEDEHIVFPKPYRTIPGLARWRRPELYRDLTTTQEAP